MDLRDQFDAAIKVLGRVSEIAQYRDKLADAKGIDRRECGNCKFWMHTGTCPREGGLGSAKGGPSCSAPACSQFEIKPWVIELKAKRLAEADAFATRCGIPIANR